MPKVSIIVPCFNQAQYLPETLNSVLAQTYHNWECIIVNDGSPDNTEEVAKEYCQKDYRFKYLYQENQGLAMARNNGIKESSGEFILPLDSDDMIHETYLEKAISHFTKYPTTKLVYCQAKKFGLINEYWDLPIYKYENLLWDNMIFCTAMYRRSDYDKTNGYNPNMKYGLEDWDFYLSLLNENDIVYQINEVLFFYRIKEVSMITLHKKLGKESLYNIYNNHKELYEPYIKNIINIHNEAQKNKLLYQRILASHSYRLGYALLHPFNLLKKYIHSINKFVKNR